MFSFFKKKPQPPASPPASTAPSEPSDAETNDLAAATDRDVGVAPSSAEPTKIASAESVAPFKESPDAAVPSSDSVIPATSTESVTGSIIEPAVGNAADWAPEAASESQIEIVAAATPVEQKQSWMRRLKSGLSKTSSNLTTLFVGAKIDDALYEELESALLVSDAGVDATEFLLDALKRKVKSEKLIDASQVKTALRALMIDMLTPLEKPLVLGKYQPMVMMITGVNGAGKTTTIGKLAKHLQAHGQSVLLAAGDTFRAAAREQLTVWGQRNNVTVIAQESGDPAAVAFDAVHSAQARGINVVMVDTAGRLPTQLHLMEELKKIKRVTAKGLAEAPHEILLVIDGNTGQNALAQVKAFDDAIGLTGLVVTKLDGTAKGGVLAAIARSRPIPVYFIGVGEQIEDLQPFVAQEFVEALLG
tara:strand:+ start:948835 stop:950091 length:1257 start_codon:yes stop_codon:yes gene_type:complete